MYDYVNTFAKPLQQAAALAPAPSRLFLFAILAMLAGCASAPTAPTEPDTAARKLREQHLQQLANIDNFAIQGRIGVQTNSKGFSGSLQWQHQSNGDDINLFSPLGSQVASITKSPDQVVLKDASGKSFSAIDAETLTQETLGWKLPLKGLTDWAIGRPAQSPIKNTSWNEQGQLTRLEQDGWNIEYDNYQKQGSYILPGKIYLKSDKLNLKLLVEKWNILAE